MTGDVFDGLSLYQLAEMADELGVDGPADAMVAFARRIRLAALHVDGRPVLLTVLNYQDEKSA